MKKQLFFLASLLATTHAQAQLVNTGCLVTEVLIQDRFVRPVLQSYGKLWVEARNQEEYSLRITNKCTDRRLAVVSVDGINVINGDKASFNGSGYILAGLGSVTIQGWRKSLQEEAKFYFTLPEDGYASRTGQGNEFEGVIAIAEFQERRIILPRAPSVSQDSNKGAFSRRSAPQEAPTAELATGHGERVTSYARTGSFDKLSNRPTSTYSIRYATREELIRNRVIGRQYQGFPAEPTFAPDPNY